MINTTRSEGRSAPGGSERSLEAASRARTIGSLLHGLSHGSPPRAIAALFAPGGHVYQAPFARAAGTGVWSLATRRRTQAWEAIGGSVSVVERSRTLERDAGGVVVRVLAEVRVAHASRLRVSERHLGMRLAPGALISWLWLDDWLTPDPSAAIRRGPERRRETDRTVD